MLQSWHDQPKEATRKVEKPSWVVARNADVIKNAFKTGCKAGDGTSLYVIKAKYNSLEIPGVLNPSLAFRRSPGSFPSALISWGFKAHEVKDYEVLLNKNGGLGHQQRTRLFHLFCQRYCSNFL